MIHSSNGAAAGASCARGRGASAMSTVSAIAAMPRSYLLDAIATERERLRVQAEAWRPATERMLDSIGVEEGWRCLDLGCGAEGVLGSLARRVGRAGSVIGLDIDPALLAQAAAFASAERLEQIELVEGDAFATGLPDASFDLVHTRFMFAPLGRHRALFAEIHRLVRPGGIVAIQEPDVAAWQCWPRSADFERLVDSIVATFAASGGDFNAGRNAYAYLRANSYADIGIRAEVLSLPGGHPYARLPLLFAESLATKLAARMGSEIFEQVKAGCNAACTDPASMITSFVVQQAWGRRG